MTLEMLIVFGILAIAFTVMVQEKFSADVVAMGTLAVLLVGGILTPAEAFGVFSNEAVITVACMFVLSESLERTGVIESIGRRLNRLAGRSAWAVLLLTLPIIAAISAFINNTPVVVVFMPIMISLAAVRGIKPSKLLIPLSFASILGGTCTLIGTSTNILVSNSASKMGMPPLGMFELGAIGLILTVAGIIYLLTFGLRLLPDRETLASLLQNTQSKQYLTEVVVAAESPLIGKTIAATPLGDQPTLRVLEVIRAGETLASAIKTIVLQQGDRLRLSSALSSMVEINSLKGVALLPKSRLGVEMVGSQKAVIVECVIAPRSSLVGRTIRQVNFRRRYGVLVLAVHRKGVNLSSDFAEMQLQYGDTLLIEGPESVVNELRGSRDFLLLLDVPESLKRREKKWMSLLTVSLVVLLAALNVMPISVLAVVGAVMVLALGCLKTEEAYEAVDWQVIFLIFGMLALGVAMEKTHGAEFLAHGIIRSMGNWGPGFVLAAVILITSVMTNFLSNNAVAVLLAPIAVQAAVELGVNPRPFLIGVAIGASACFATPIGYQTNTLVYGAGGYTFRDFLKVGLPLNLIVWLLASVLIPLFWVF